MRSVLEQAKGLLKEKAKHRRWLSLLLCFAIVVSSGTTALLTLTGIAFSKEKRVLQCPVSEAVAHSHDENCNDEDGRLVCTLPELEEHTHGPSCFAIEKNLTCGLEESEGHVHDESCYATMRGELICTNEDEEHEHTEECYAYESALICGLKEGAGAHTHTDDCYEEKVTLICEKPEITKTHVHTEACFAVITEDEPEQTKAAEAEPASPERTQPASQEPDTTPASETTEASAPEATEDTTAQETAESSVPTEPETTQTPVTTSDEEQTETSEQSGEQETSETAETTAPETVTDPETVPVPGTETEPENTQEPETSAAEETSADAPEGPVSDPYADVETAAMWEERFASITLTGLWRNDLLTIAGTQLGYRESEKNFETAADGSLNGITRYGQWAGRPYGDWNSMFVMFCLHYAGIPAEEFPACADPGQFKTALAQKSRNAFCCFMTAAEHFPEAGDIIFFDAPAAAGEENNADPKTTVGIVSATGTYSDGRAMVKVIEGDHQNAVAETTYPYIELKNVSFGILPENLEEAQFPARHFEQTAGGLNVTVDAERGTFPAGTVMMVAPVQDDTVIFAATGAVDANVIGVQAVDITFCTASGEPVEPLLPVRVTMSRTNDTAPVDPVVVHVDDEGEATIIEQTEEKQEDEDGVVFEADAFSVYALVYTVDLHWEVNGRQYDFGIPGGGFVNFSRLVESLGITGEEESEKAQDPAEPAGDALELNRLKVTEQTKLFVAQVEQMSFSAPDLVWVGKAESDTTIGALKAENALAVEYSADLTQEQIDEIDAQTVMAGDWVLISVKPFDTEETLTVTLSDGQSFSILVTDAQITETVITASGETWEITVTYGPAARIPDGAKLQVREILPEDPEYAEYYRKAMREIGLMVAPDEGTPAAEDTAGPEAGPDGTDQEEPFEGMEGVDYSRFFDIEILADGEKVEPQAEVTVDIRLLDAPDTVETTPKVVHFGAEGPELMDITETEAAEFRFASDEFSVYSVVYTVDFHFEYNGRTFDFTLKGGDAVSFARLAEVLGLAESYEQVENMPAGADEPADVDGSTEDAVATDADAVTNDDIQISDATGRYLEQVEKVEFTDPQLLWVGKIEKDCITWDIQEANGLEISFVSGTTQDEYNELMTRRFTAPDWVLISLKPFETEEALLITMKSGDVLAIKVTDDQNAVMIDDGEGGQKVQTIANPSGTTIDLFDYWIVDNYNYRAANGTNYYITRNTEGRAAWPGHYGNDNFGYDFDFFNYYGQRQSGWHKYQDAQGNWQVETGYLVGDGNNRGINQGHTFKFTPSTSGGVIDGTLRDGYQSANAHDYRSTINSWTGTTTPTQGLLNNQLVDGYPQLSTNPSLGTNGESLDYLFTQENGTGKEYMGSVDQLLYVDPDGYYTYDSRDYSAEYSDGTFTLREQTSDNSEVRGFWPFGSRQYWFGMHMTTEFSMPANGQVLNPKGEYKDMVFEFSGDDDCWLYVDGVLIGDAGGVHLRSDVSVNFKTGEITVSGKDPVWLDDIFRAAGKYDDYEWEGHTFKSGTYHKFEMFYLERGGGESNLHIKYNLVSTTDFTAHKSYHTQDDSRLERDQFRFELIGFDNPDYAGQGQEFVSAIMPGPATGWENGAGTVASPKKVHNNTAPEGLELSQDLTAHTSLITGVTEDGNVNFGNIQVQASQDGMEYRYIVREVVSDDAVNADGVRWDEASAEVKAEGGFVRDGITYDGKVYYFTGKVQETEPGSGSYVLKKTRYTDATYSEIDTETKFFSFVNGYVQPITLKVLKKSESGKLLSGAEFSLVRAMQNSDGKWVIRQYPHEGEMVTVTPRTGTTSAGVLTFDNLTEGHYILEETAAPPGYEREETYRWLLTLTKEDSADEIVLVPVIRALDADGNPVGTAETLQPDANHVIEHEVLNGKIPQGDITVEKKWLKKDGVTEYTDAELEALGVDATQITGELWRRGETAGTVTNPTVTIYSRLSNQSSYQQRWTGQVESGSDVTFSMAVNGTGYPVNREYTTDSGAAVVRAGDRDITFDNGIHKSSAHVFSLQNVTQDTNVYGVFDSSQANSLGIGFYLVDYTEPSDVPEVQTIDEKFADFTLRKGAWSKTWTAQELYGSDLEDDWTYYFRNVREEPALEDFEFTEAPEVNVVGTTTTYTYKNIYQKVSIRILKVVEGTETPLPGATFELTLVDSDRHVINDDSGHPVWQRTGTTAGESGELVFEGLTPGNWYRLDETGLPAGFVKNEGPYYIYINENGTGTIDITVAHDLIDLQDGNVYTIQNPKGKELPMTGGPGTFGPELVGLALVAVATAWLGMRMIKGRMALRRKTGRAGPPKGVSPPEGRRIRAPMAAGGREKPQKGGAGR